MCGFVGFFSKEFINAPNSIKNILKSMNSTIIHRGPNAEGYWVDSSLGVGLAHRRLSIIDLSKHGAQPMTSENGSHILVYNGEIYNHKALLKELKDNFKDILIKGHSDTEILLAGFERWGVFETIKKSVGMFAFAVWNKKDKILTLGRDRFGEKPLYYGLQGEGSSKVFLFGSELKALAKHPAFEKKINKNAVTQFIQYSNIPAPSSIYQKIYKLMPGHLLEYSYENENLNSICYWSAIDSYSKLSKNIYSGNLDEASTKLENLLITSVKEQMLSDVPSGAFLSGGIDSSTIAALMQSNSSKPIKTFSIGFKEKNYDESSFANVVAKHLGTDHSELYLTSLEAIKIIPQLPEIYDEPFADSSQIPTILLSVFVKKKVTVALSGDGADELFGGYNRHIFTNYFWEKINILPVILKKFISFIIKNSSLDKLSYFNIFYNNFANKIKKIDNLILKKNIYELYVAFISASGHENIAIKTKKEEEVNILHNLYQTLNRLSHVQKIMLLDLVTYLSNDILTKVDRASMSIGLETRMPFLDHRIVDFSFKLPIDYKIKDSKTKIILRKVLNKYVPPSIYERSKSGFAVPISLWLKTSLKDWAEDLINIRRMKEEGFLNSDEVHKIWNEHLENKKNHESLLWNILMFQSWIRKNC
jgi:asparagine synthase (glutamine-hydrolysing)